ncbi:MAG: hypothetical protein IJF69_03715 [Clostridia bacterium]|nr:hypothetical protein [Clostridia bacterium]
MKLETKKRIEAYQKALPHMKERVTAVALLFVMSISMVISASFAWVTLSKAPAINGLATTISTNGNLEIALSDKDGLEPDPTTTSDGSGDITQSNLTWGNLINLSHESYGLSNLTLRPAVLNTGSLLTKPLYSVEYHSDGRISEVISDFAYTNYSTKDGGNAFFVPEDGKTQYGVRAISSVTYSSVTGDAKLVALNKKVEKEFSEADSAFDALWNDDKYMKSITSLAGVYLSWRMSDDGNGGNVDQDCTSYVQDLYNMMNSYKDCLYKTGEAVLAAANLHYFVYCNQNNVTFSEFTMDQLHDGTVKSKLTAAGISVAGLDPYLADHKTFNGTVANNYTDGSFAKFCTQIYEPWKQSQSIGWVALNPHINVMADINSATINGTAASKLGSSELIGLVTNSTKICELTKGLIWNMDWFYGGKVSVTDASVTVKNVPIIGTTTQKLTEVRTSAKAVVQSGTDAKHKVFPLIETVNESAAKAAAGGLAATDAVAADTYGMVIDFWLRTNSPKSLLTLAGDVITETVEVLDEEGNPLIDEDTGLPVTETIVKGYSGANRIWEDDDPELPVLGDSTSQGSGSCYIFYPETPEDQVQALEMLSAMRVAFIDEEGNLLAQADMDTSMAFEDMGRVLVPLKLRAKSIVTGVDENGNDIVENAYFIMPMTQNEATRITAIIYMDGARLENSNVLASGSIKGQLNIQFGTSEDLISVDDAVKDEYYKLTVYPTTETTFDGYDPENKPKVNVELILEGMEANSIKGQFVSYISSTQGANQPEFSFEHVDGNKWAATVEFDSSGSFQLRSIRINGVDYPLATENIITVEIPGITVRAFNCVNWENQNYKTVMTADPVYQLNSMIQLNTSAGINPKKVQGVFVNDSAQNVTVDYILSNSGWYEARTNFTTSGTYTMTYIIIDGTYVPLESSMHKTLVVYVGLKTQIFLGLPMTAEYQEKLTQITDAEDAELAAYRSANPNATEAELMAAIQTISEKYEPQKQALYDEAYGEEGLNLKQTAAGYELIYAGGDPLFMNVTCTITDDRGNPMTDLNDVALHYGIGTSMLNRLDSDMEWNGAQGRYAGEFTLSRPGTYTFQNLEIGKGEDKNIIAVAVGAPKITAISPVPMEYVGASSNNVTYVEDIDPAYEAGTKTRLLSIVLKNAASADVLFTMKNLDTDEVLELSGIVVVPEDEATGKIEYAPSYVLNGRTVAGLPTDGNWKIVGLSVANVFYDDVYYDGSPVEEGGTGRFDLTDEVLEDNISCEYFTTIKFSASAQPAARYENVAFMGDAFNKEMVFTITDYKGDKLENASVTLSYVWQDDANKNFTYSGGTIAENLRVVGGKATASADGKTFSVGTLNFKLDGTYKVTFEITFDKVHDGTTKKYTYNDISKFTASEAGKFVAGDVTVVWAGPDVKFTAVSTHSTKNTLAADGYSITVYHYEKEGGCIKDHAPSQAKAKITNAANMESATLTFAGSNATVNFSFTANNQETAFVNIGGTGNGSSNSVRLNTVTVNSIVLKYGGVNYTVTLNHSVTINNPGTE